MLNKKIITRQSHSNIIFNSHPVLQRVFAGRAAPSRKSLDYSLNNLLTYHLLSGIDNAVMLLAKHIQAKSHILIIADFDTDGASSCALAIKALRQMGAKYVTYLVPNRFEFGYGLSPQIVTVAIPLNPDLIITVDNGISSHTGVINARKAGIDVLITDHHLPLESVPNANAIINPTLSGDQFASKNLAGVGVIFYVMLALRAYFKREKWFTEKRPMPDFSNLLDLVALGTIADLVPLDHNNRILVFQGIKRIRKGRCCPGIKALVSIAKRPLEHLKSSDLGFSIAPRLNAAGRLTDMSVGIECLLSQDLQQAMPLAKQLDELNQERRSIQIQMQKEADMLLEKMQLNTNKLPSGLCLFQPDWHEGIVGILAGRLKDRWQRPAIAFARNKESNLLKGSARSIEGLHIRDLLDNIAGKKPNLIGKFGGHAMAAGLTIKESDFSDFQYHFIKEVTNSLTEEDLEGTIITDGMLTQQELTLSLAKAIDYYNVWGQGFPEPLFFGEFELLSQKIVGQQHLKMRLRPIGEKRGNITAISFNTKKIPATLSSLLIVYRLSIDRFSEERLTLIISYIEPLSKDKEKQSATNTK